MNINKIIFVHFPHENILGGLPIIDRRNRELLTAITTNIVDISVSKEARINNTFFRYFNYIKSIFVNPYKGTIAMIQREIIDPNSTMVFVSHSTYGTLIKDLKITYPNLKIACFFHNVEITMAYNRLKFKFHILHLYEWIYNYVNEFNSTKYSNYLFTLNNRDKKLIKRCYRSKKEIHLLPTSLKDRCFGLKVSCTQNKLKILFVGTYFWGNIPGLVKFIKEVMPHTDAQFYAVGNGLERLIIDYSLTDIKNVHILGRVSSEELDTFYKDSDIFVAPIYSGGGMKTKVAEAMMFGLPVIGTNEAFCGYDIDISSIGYCVNSSIDYLHAIKELELNRELLLTKSQNARLLFENNYSIEASIKILKSIFNL